ncbi:MAG: hypothetical protein KF809_14865 [Chloroflexi bacterium]|nr:hypothetical protein [Chloroflexota bacterium]
MSRCPMCGDAVERSGIGRPRTYCSRSCQRLANNEVARLGRRLGAIELGLDRVARDLVTAADDVMPGNSVRRYRLQLRRRQEALEAQHDELTGRMRDLVSALGTTNSSTGDTDDR